MRHRHPGWWLPVAALAAIGVAPAVAAAASGACPTLTDGVTVVVDFQGLGGGTVVRCAPGDPASGLAALDGAGFDVDQVQSWPGVVCRIDARPGPDREDCQDMPPGDAYWAYFRADRGGSWRYSSTGPGRYDPDVGSVEGWSFSEGGGAIPPRVPPPDEPPPQAEPEPEPEPEDGGDAGSTGATDAPRAERTAAPPTEPAGEPSPDDRGTGRTHPPVTSALRPDPSFPTEPAATTEPSPEPSASPPPSSEPQVLANSEAAGSPTGTVAASALIASLAAAAGFVTRRRREGTP